MNKELGIPTTDSPEKGCNPSNLLQNAPFIKSGFTLEPPTPILKPMTPLGIITDEVSSDFARACELVSEWGLSHVELRVLWGKNILQLSEEEVAEVKRILDQYGLAVTGIASPVFKSPLDGKPREVEADFALSGSETLEGQLELLTQTCELCDTFDTKLIRVFTFWDEPWSDALVATVAEKLLQAALIAQQYDKVLAIENEPVCSVGTGRELGALLKVLEARATADLRPYLGGLWDPGNALAAGETPYPNGYEALKDRRVVHVHLKDLTFTPEGEPTFVPVGEGQVDYAGQLHALAEAGYEGAFVLEPHYNPEDMAQEEAAKACVTAAQTFLERYFAQQNG